MRELYKDHLSKILCVLDQTMQENDYDEIVLYSGEAKTIYLDDNRYPYKVYTNFKYFLPVLKNPHSFIRYKRGEKPELIVFQKVDYWDSQPKELQGEWTEFFNITYYNSLDDMQKVLPTNLKNTAFLGEEINRFENFSFKSLNDYALIHVLHFSRTIKSAYEVECMRRANSLASRAHIAARTAFLEGKSELETHLVYLKALSYKEEEVPYTNIVAFDESAAILHYVDYKTHEYEAKSFLLDAGASYRGYHADITRTHVKEGHESFKDLIQAVDASCLNIISKIKTNMNYEVLQEQMHLDTAEILAEFKFMNISADEIYEKEYTKLFSPAGVGHYIGLQVHDIGNTISDKYGKAHTMSKKHPFLRLNKNIEENNVFTIEPGVYVIDQLLKNHLGKKEFNWDVISHFRSYGGARVEDSVYINKNEVENITRPYLP